MVYYKKLGRSWKEEAEFTAEIINFQSRGYKIIDLANPGLRVKTPSGKVFSRSDLENILRRLEFGNRKQIEFQYFPMRPEYNSNKIKWVYLRLGLVVSVGNK